MIHAIKARVTIHYTLLGFEHTATVEGGNPADLLDCADQLLRALVRRGARPMFANVQYHNSPEVPP